MNEWNNAFLQNEGDKDQLTCIENLFIYLKMRRFWIHQVVLKYALAYMYSSSNLH